MHISWFRRRAIAAFRPLQATLGEADKEFQGIMALVTEVQSIAQKYQIPGGLDNPYTTLTSQVRPSAWVVFSALYNQEVSIVMIFLLLELFTIVTYRWLDSSAEIV